MVSVAWTFNSSILTFSFFQVFRTIFRFHELKVSSFCRHKKRLGSTTSHEHRRRKRLDGWLCALRKRSILIRNRLSAIYSLDFGYYHYDNISNPICSVPAFIKKICITSWRSGCSKIISTLPKWHKYYKKYTRIQRCLSKISCYCRILETVHLSSRSPDIG